LIKKKKAGFRPVKILSVETIELQIEDECILYPYPFEVFKITHAAIRYGLLQQTLQLSVASLHPFVNQKLAQNFMENEHHKVLNASYLTKTTA